MRKGHLVVLASFFAAFASCAEIPKEAVELSTTVGRDLQEVHAAHRELVLRYFSRTKADINTFVDEVYRPYVIQKSIEDFELEAKLRASLSGTTGFDALTLLDVFVTKVGDEIEDFRGELLSPVQAEEEKVLAAIDDSYEKLHNANAIVTGHLASVRKVKDVQAQLLEKVGLKELQEGLMDRTVELSEGVGELVETGLKIEGDDARRRSEVEGVVERLKGAVLGASASPGQVE